MNCPCRPKSSRPCAWTKGAAKKTPTLAATAVTFRIMRMTSWVGSLLGRARGGRVCTAHAIEYERTRRARGLANRECRAHTLRNGHGVLSIAYENARQWIAP